MSNPDFDIKSGGDADAYARATQSNEDPTKLFNKGFDVGVANPDVLSDEDVTKQGQSTQAGAFGGAGGEDNVYQSTKV